MLLLIASISSPEDRDLMTEFYETKLPLLFHEAGKFISGKEDIEDVVYEAFAKIIEKIDIFKTLSPKQRDKYAAVTVRNLCFLHLRKESHFSIVPFDELLDTPDFAKENDPEQLAVQNDMFDQVHAIISELKTEERLLLEQKYILQWTDVEMAQLYGIKTNNMRVKLTRIKDKLFSQMMMHNFRIKDWKD